MFISKIGKHHASSLFSTLRQEKRCFLATSPLLRFSPNFHLPVHHFSIQSDDNEKDWSAANNLDIKWTPKSDWNSSNSEAAEDEWDWVPPKRSDDELEELREDDEEYYEIYDIDDEGTEIEEMSEEVLQSLSTWSREELDEPITEIPVIEGKMLTVEEIEAALRSNAGIDVTVLDLSDKVTHVESMVLATARSTMHMRKLSKIIYQGAKARGQSTINPASPVEGYDGDDWMLVDLENVMVHIFSKEAREYYDVEGYWQKEFDVEEDATDDDEDELLFESQQDEPVR